MSEKKMSKKSIWAVTLRTAKLNFVLRWRHSRLRTIGFLIASLLPGVMYALSAPTLEFFVGGIEHTARGGAPGMMLLGALALCAVQMSENALAGMRSYIDDIEEEYARRDLTAMLMQAFARKEPICFEDPAKLDDIEKSKQGIDRFSRFYWMLISEGVYTLAYLMITLVYFGMKSPLLAALMVLAMIPMVIAGSFIRKQHEKHEQDMAPVRRATDYCEKAIIDRDNYKETRILGAFSYFHGRYKRHIGEQAALQKKLLIRQKLIDSSGNLISLIGFAVMLAVLVWELAAGRVSAAAFAAILASLLTIYQELAYFCMNAFHTLTGYLPALENMFNALDMPERTGCAQTADGLRGVSLENVHFRYPGAEQEAVRGVSLQIAPGETIAVVGENGAGKTTLVRLITGLYLPSEGSVQIGGADTKKIDLPSAMANSSAVFQKYMKYRLSLQENVRISRTDAEEPYAQALELAGLPADSACFPDGENTMLSREFGGVDLSGGQWQRVAIARGLYRSHGMIVLDEPTAAIDPLEETRVYRKFAELSRGKTAVIVTHRMGSARIANRIVVMKDGGIEDIGTHDELMARGGEYARMVNAQADWYSAEKTTQALSE